MKVRFDDSFPAMVEVIVAELGDEVLQEGTILRDAVGCLTFFARNPLDEDIVSRVSSRLRAALGAYARKDRVLVSSDDYGASTMHEDPVRTPVPVGDRRAWLVDRRLVGADWLSRPSQLAPPPPRIVFASLKGGVGRSTAIAVVAAHLAARGDRVLVVDLDMEAPGLGSLLLTKDTVPQFGLIDALVENGISGLDDAFYVDLIGPSGLAYNHGRIDVVPALGTRSLENPGEVLAKIARAYITDVQPNGQVLGFMDQIRALIDELANRARYDAILVDARAGLHETTAAAVLGLGADVLLFGIDEPQTFDGYSILLAHLARFLDPDKGIPEWLERLTMVQGKASADRERRAAFAERCRDLFAQAGLIPTQRREDIEAVLPPEGLFKDIPWDDDVPDEEALPPLSSLSEPIAILHDSQFLSFDPLQRRDLLSEGLYQKAFGGLLNRIDAIRGK